MTLYEFLKKALFQANIYIDLKEEFLQI